MCSGSKDNTWTTAWDIRLQIKSRRCWTIELEIKQELESSPHLPPCIQMSINFKRFTKKAASSCITIFFLTGKISTGFQSNGIRHPVSCIFMITGLSHQEPAQTKQAWVPDNIKTFFSRINWQCFPLVGACAEWNVMTGTQPQCCWSTLVPTGCSWCIHLLEFEHGDPVSKQCQVRATLWKSVSSLQWTLDSTEDLPPCSQH